MSTILTMDKSQIRKQYKILREGLSKTQIEDRSISIANRCLELPIWNKQIMHIFLSIENQKEVDTSFLRTLLQGKDKEIVIPKIIDSERLQHFLLTDHTLFKKNSLGIPEPVSGIEIKPSLIDVVFIPLLSFDYKGNRVGYGKGYYDRFLLNCKEECLKIGLSFFEEEQCDFDVEDTDISLDFCVTPKQVYQYA
ncbi:MAG: 5-formyltetrahydrofolate cyclo-ligase [Flavobacteriaceae bacterium]